MAGIFTGIREKWKTWLLASTDTFGESGITPASFFAHDPAIQVFTEKQSDIDSLILAALGDIGLNVMIATIFGEAAQNQHKGQLGFTKIHCVARCMEDPAINPTGIAASDLAEIVALFSRRFVPWGAPMLLQDIRMGKDPLAPVVWDAHFLIEVTREVSINRVDFLVDDQGNNLTDELGRKRTTNEALTEVD